MRITTDDALMTIAHVWEARSTCSRNHVGAVIAKDGRHIGSGYNGAPAGMPHCEHEVMEFDPFVKPVAIKVRPGQPCTVAIHAEANALAYCARDGISVAGGTLYTTLSPCYSCAQLIIAAGLVRVAYTRAYRDPAGINLLRAAGVTVDQMARQ
jgi:dCMP deaminase